MRAGNAIAMRQALASDIQQGNDQVRAALAMGEL